ncbi:MAG: RNA 2',3'-cyclic phosphodiesterase [Steroidobacteraceae bacterium]
MRLFFALWPSEDQRAALVALTGPAIAPVAGKPVQPANLHVTLAFLGLVPGRTFVHLVEIGGRSAGEAVDLAFQRLEYWHKPRVVVAVPGRVPSAGRRLVDRLWTELEALGYERERRPWQPHLTLVRHVRQPPSPGFGPTLPAKAAAAAAFGWGLALVESSTHPEGARYRPLANWPLG